MIPFCLFILSEKKAHLYLIYAKKMHISTLKVHFNT